MSHLVLALAFDKLHQPDRAQAELLQGWQAVELKLPDKLDEISGLGDSEKGYWSDWVTACLLMNEAAANIAPVPLTRAVSSAPVVAFLSAVADRQKNLA